MTNFAFTGGVKLGGLTSPTEIRILLCYLLTSVQGGLTREELETALLGEELANYFEYSTALGGLVEAGLISFKNNIYSITDTGRTAAITLESELPYSVKTAALAAAARAQRFTKKEKQNQTRLEALPDGGFMVHCRIAENDTEDEIFSFSILMPDKTAAVYVQNQFVKNGDNIFEIVLKTLTAEIPEE